MNLKFKVLVTGSAGFIGMHTVQYLAQKGYELTGLDSINDYYDKSLKYARLSETGIDCDAIRYGQMLKSSKLPSYQFVQLDLTDKEGMSRLFEDEKFDIVCHLAAQAGVRYSLENPDSYIESNIVGFMNILECCRKHRIKHLVYASSSSVYGLIDEMPLSPQMPANHPVSLYAATKKSNEMMAHSYSHLYALPTTGLRFFTVYGPYGRPDMSPFIFTKAILKGEPLKVFNGGDMMRDFTFIDDIVVGISNALETIPVGDPCWKSDTATSTAPFTIYNIGASKPVKLIDFISTLEAALGKKAQKAMLPMQPGDVKETFADMSKTQMDLNYMPQVSVKDGVERFVEWYAAYYEGGTH